MPPAGTRNADDQQPALNGVQQQLRSSSALFQFRFFLALASGMASPADPHERREDGIGGTSTYANPACSSCT
jgi:hypothetical protein